MAFSQQTEKLQVLQQKLEAGDYAGFEVIQKQIDTLSLAVPNKAYYYYLLAKHLELNNKEGKAFKHYINSRKLYRTADSIDKAMDINLDIAYLIQAQENNNIPYKKYIDEYLDYALQTGDTLKIVRSYGNMAMYYSYGNEFDKSIDYYKKGLVLLKKSNLQNIKSAFYNNLAGLYNDKLNQPDSGIYYLKKDLILLKETGGRPEDYYYNYVNLASSYSHKGNYYTANKYLLMADSLPIENYELKSKRIIYDNLQQNYAGLGNYKNAYQYLNLVRVYGDSINEIQQNIAINDIQTKYKTKETEQENQLLKEKSKTRLILLYTFIGLLAASLIIGFLIIKNARRKQKIAQQGKLIEQQKLEKALKEYELSSIDLMLEGQEKERQRIANELHDNLGSMLATLKINFEHLKLRKDIMRDEENKLYQKTDELIEEAYQKVRRMAHAKNAGVIANEGLIPALKKLAAKIATPGKLEIEVLAFGFNERLENTREITLFRMVQELVTNIIKHAKATEASIQLTLHDDIVNIIIEDNGKGFNTDTIDDADGMGIISIKKKTTQLGGTFTIDSTPGRGTTIVIDLPI